MNGCGCRGRLTPVSLVVLFLAVVPLVFLVLVASLVVPLLWDDSAIREAYQYDAALTRFGRMQASIGVFDAADPVYTWIRFLPERKKESERVDLGVNWYGVADVWYDLPSGALFLCCKRRRLGPTILNGHAICGSRQESHTHEVRIHPKGTLAACLESDRASSAGLVRVTDIRTATTLHTYESHPGVPPAWLESGALVFLSDCTTLSLTAPSFAVVKRITLPRPARAFCIDPREGHILVVYETGTWALFTSDGVCIGEASAPSDVVEVMLIPFDLETTNWWRLCLTLRRQRGKKYAICESLVLNPARSTQIAPVTLTENARPFLVLLSDAYCMAFRSCTTRSPNGSPP